MNSSFLNRIRWLAGLLMLVLSAPGLYAVAVEPLYLSNAPPRVEGPFKPESEHRPVPVRKYWLAGDPRPGETRAYVLHPLGTAEEVPLEFGPEGASLTFTLPMQDGPMHGVHAVYAVSTRVVEAEEIVRVAQWITIHHSCGWGHPYKYDPQRVNARSLASMPLEILCDGFWNGNFHSESRSGNRMEVRILSYGTPVAGGKVRIVSGRGWTKEIRSDRDGRASFQLLRDYYPEGGEVFSPTHRERLAIEAEVELAETGASEGLPFERKRLVATTVWHYDPSRDDFTSLRSGLFIGALVLSLAGAGIYAYRERRRRPYQEVVLHERD